MGVVAAAQASDWTVLSQVRVTVCKECTSDSLIPSLPPSFHLGSPCLSTRVQCQERIADLPLEPTVRRHDPEIGRHPVRERYQAAHQVDPQIQPAGTVGLGEVEGQVPEVEHGDAVELVLPGVDELALRVVAALRLGGHGAGMAGVDGRGCGALVGEGLPPGSSGRVGVAEAELRASDLEGGFVGGLEGELGGGLVVRFFRHEPHRLVERAFADDPGVLGPVLFVESAMECGVQG